MCEYCEVKSFVELQKVVSLEDVRRALHAQEYNRIYRKRRYLRREEILALAYKRGLDKEVKDII